MPGSKPFYYFKDYPEENYNEADGLNYSECFHQKRTSTIQTFNPEDIDQPGNPGDPRNDINYYLAKCYNIKETTKTELARLHQNLLEIRKIEMEVYHGIYSRGGDQAIAEHTVASLIANKRNLSTEIKNLKQEQYLCNLSIIGYDSDYYDDLYKICTADPDRATGDTGGASSLDDLIPTPGETAEHNRKAMEACADAMVGSQLLGGEDPIWSIGTIQDPKCADLLGEERAKCMYRKCQTVDVGSLSEACNNTRPRPHKLFEKEDGSGEKYAFERITNAEHPFSPRHKFDADYPGRPIGEFTGPVIGNCAPERRTVSYGTCYNPDGEDDTAPAGASPSVITYCKTRSYPCGPNGENCQDTIIPIVDDILCDTSRRQKAFEDCEKCVIGDGSRGQGVPGVKETCETDPNTLEQVCQCNEKFDACPTECGGCTTHKQCCEILLQPVVPDNMLNIRTHVDAFGGDMGDRVPINTGATVELERPIAHTLWRNTDIVKQGAGEPGDKPWMMWWEEGMPRSTGWLDSILGPGQEQSVSFAGEDVGNHPHANCRIGGWEEMKLYQARCQQFGQTRCICNYEEVFKIYSAEEYVLMRAGVIQTVGVGDITAEKIQSLPVHQHWPLSWRGYVSDNNSKFRFPYLNSDPARVSAAIQTNLDQALPGDILIWDEAVYEAGYGEAKRYLPHVAFVGAVDTVTNATCTKLCATNPEASTDCRCEDGAGVAVNPRVNVWEYNFGKFPDMCGNTDRLGVETTRTLYRTIPSNVPIPQDVRDANPELSCRDSNLKRCNEEIWQHVKVYRPTLDVRRNGYNNAPAGTCSAAVDTIDQMRKENGAPISPNRARHLLQFDNEIRLGATGVADDPATTTDETVLGDRDKGCDPPLNSRDIFGSPVGTIYAEIRPANSNTTLDRPLDEIQKLPPDHDAPPSPSGTIFTTDIGDIPQGGLPDPKIGENTGEFCEGSNCDGGLPIPPPPTSSSGGSGGTTPFPDTGADPMPDDWPVSMDPGGVPADTPIAPSCQRQFSNLPTERYYNLTDILANGSGSFDGWPDAIDPDNFPEDAQPRSEEMCQLYRDSNPDWQCLDAPICQLTAGAGQCDGEGYCRRTEDAAHPLHCTQEDANYRQGGYSEDYVADHLYYRQLASQGNKRFLFPPDNDDAETWLRYMTANPPVAWLRDLTSQSCWMVGGELCPTYPNNPARLLYLWDKYNQRETGGTASNIYNLNTDYGPVTDPNAAALGIRPGETVAILVSDTMYRGQAAIVTGWDQVNQCVNVVSSNWPRPECSSSGTNQFDAKNCYQANQSFTVPCSTQCVPLNGGVAMMWNPSL